MGELDIARIDWHVERGNISRRFHPDYDYLAILNYTPQCQYEGNWDEITMMSRGLIYDHTSGLLVSRPFPKFFNLQEHEQKPELGELPNRLPDAIFEKMDGSLGISYPTPDGIKIATRGSFTSEQAIWANNHLDGQLDSLSGSGVTALFEIIYPENRIVVNYGNYAGLVLLDAVWNADGTRATNLDDLLGPDLHKFDSAQPFTPDSDLTSLVETRPNTEGVVVVWEQPKGPPVRAKIKSSEYVALHRFVFGLSSHRIWEWLSDPDGNPLPLETIPEEFEPWVQQKSQELKDQYSQVFKQAHKDWQQAVSHLGALRTRKDFAQYNFANSKYPSLVFSLEDGKDIQGSIWKMIEPDKTDKPERT